MIRKVKSSLFAKVFFITAAMLLCVSLLVYGLLAWLMPQTYSNRLNAVLDERAQAFISELGQVAFSDSGGLFDQFISDMEINSVELYNGSGEWVSLPTREFDNEWGVNIAQTAVTGLGETSPVLSNQYYFFFLIAMTAIHLLSMERQNIFRSCSSLLYAFYQLSC